MNWDTYRDFKRLRESYDRRTGQRKGNIASAIHSEQTNVSVQGNIVALGADNRGRINKIKVDPRLQFEMSLYKLLQGNRPLHTRRTLDQYYYGSLDDTALRDKDQTVSKWSGQNLPLRISQAAIYMWPCPGA